MAVGLDQLRKVAKKAVTPKATTSKMREKNLQASNPALHGKIVELCEIAAVSESLKPQFEQRLNVVKREFLEMYAEEMFANKSKPDNFKVVVMEEGMLDSSVNSIFKFRDDALKAKFKGELPPDMTLEDMIRETLCGLGVQDDHVNEFVRNEVEIKESYEFSKPLPEIMGMDDASVEKRALTKLLTYMAARPTKKAQNVSVAPLTDEEQESLFAVRQTPKLKAGVEERLMSYCSSVEELIILLEFLAMTIQVSNYEFGVSDEARTKVDRMKVAAAKFLNPADES